jgi:hypothetical protein
MAKNKLVEIGRLESEWSVLYLDESDGRYWELTYPNDSNPGANIPSLEPRSLGEVTGKYKILVTE